MADPIRRRLAEISTSLGFEPCSDGACVFGHRGGMQTNGGCHCLSRVEDRSGINARRIAAVAHRAVKLLIDEEARRG